MSYIRLEKDADGILELIMDQPNQAGNTLGDEFIEAMSQAMDDIEAMKMTSSIGPIGPPPTDEVDIELLDEVDVSDIVGELDDDEEPGDSSDDEEDEPDSSEPNSNNLT